MKRFFDPGHRHSEREFETFLRASGLSRSQAKGVLACGYKALAEAAGDGSEDAADAEILRRLNDSIEVAVKDNLAAAWRHI